MRGVSLVLILLGTLAGCQITNIEGEVDDVKVKVSTNDKDNGTLFMVVISVRRDKRKKETVKSVFPVKTR